MTREELKEIIGSVVEKMETCSPVPACGLFWADAVPIYAIPQPDYMVGEPEPLNVDDENE